MKFNNIEIDNSILEALKDNKLVVFAGAGVSIGSPCCSPSFGKLAKKMGIKNNYPYDGVCDIPDFLDELSSRSNNVWTDASEIIYSEHLDREVETIDQNLRANSLHYNLIKFCAGKSNRNIRLITTNQDHYFTKSFKECVSSAKHNNIYYAPELPKRTNFDGLVYLHGAFEKMTDGSKLVFTRKEFGDAYFRSSFAAEFLKLLFLSDYTVVVVGYSYNDNLVKELTHAFGDDLKTWYAFSHIDHEEEREQVKDRWAKLGISPIIYKADKSHSILHSVIEELSNFSLVSDGEYITNDELAELVEKLTINIVGINEDDTEFLKNKINGDYTSLFCNNAKTKAHLIWCLENNLLEGYLFDSIIKNSVLYFWVVKMFFEFPEELFRIKQNSTGEISGLFWEQIIRCFCYYIDDNKEKLDIEYINNRLDYLVPFILEYNPIKLSRSNDGYKFVITWLVQQLFIVDDDICFDYAIKLLLYVTTSHTTMIYSKDSVNKSVRFYGDAYLLNQIAKEFSPENYSRLNWDVLSDIVKNIETAKVKLNKIPYYNYSDCIMDEQEIYSLIVLLKGYCDGTHSAESNLYKKLRHIIDEANEIEESRRRVNAEVFWKDSAKQKEVINIDFLKEQGKKKILEWIDNPEGYVKYCRAEHNFDYKDTINILQALGDAFEDDHEFIVDIICSIGELPLEIYYSIPSTMKIADSDKSLIQSISRLLECKGKSNYYGLVLQFLLSVMSDNKIWFVGNFTEIERVLFHLQNNIKSQQEELNVVDNSRKDYLTMALNSFGGRYGELLVTCLNQRFIAVSSVSEWSGIPEQYKDIINMIILGENDSLRMARIMIYHNLYFVDSKDTQSTIDGLYEGLYWRNGKEEVMFIQAWQGFLWAGRIYDINVSELFMSGLKNCVDKFALFSSEMRRRVVEYIVLVIVNYDKKEIYDVASALLLKVIKFMDDLGNDHVVVFRQILRSVKELSKENLDLQLESWLSDFISKRVLGNPSGVDIVQEELENIIYLLYYVSAKQNEFILDRIQDCINVIDESSFRGFSLLIENPLLDNEYVFAHENCLAIAKAFEITASKHTKGQFHYASNSLLRIICVSGEIYYDVFEIIKKGIEDSKLDYEERKKLIDELQTAIDNECNNNSDSLDDLDEPYDEDESYCTDESKDNNDESSEEDTGD